MANTPDRKPDDDELDVFGLTHTGKVRTENQDQFLLAALHKRLTVLRSSLSEAQLLPFAERRLAFIAMVADGVGGGAGGAEASSTTVEAATEYIIHSMDCYDRKDAGEEAFIHALEDAALKAHEVVQAKAKQNEDQARMATTLTLWMGVWPWYYLLQVGDSRYYLYQDGTLTQITRDQTIAQELLDQGIFTRAIAERSHFKNVLSSAIGGESSVP